MKALRLAQATDVKRIFFAWDKTQLLVGTTLLDHNIEIIGRGFLPRKPPHHAPFDIVEILLPK